jgi:hypothetical protein
VDKTSAERSRRYRHHKAGDHAFCDPNRCEAIRPATVTPVTEAATQDATPARLGPRGAQLWLAVERESDLGAGQRVLLLEACRITDRLDNLDRQLRGEDWLRFRHDESGAEVTVYVDRALAEARGQAIALKGIVAELRQTLKHRPVANNRGGVLVDLAAQIAKRRNAQGPA